MDDLFIHLKDRVTSITYLKSLIKNQTNDEFYGSLTLEKNKEKTRLIVETEIINCLYAFKKFRVGDLIYFQRETIKIFEAIIPDFKFSMEEGNLQSATFVFLSLFKLVNQEEKYTILQNKIMEYKQHKSQLLLTLIQMLSDFTKLMFYSVFQQAQTYCEALKYLKQKTIIDSSIYYDKKELLVNSKTRSHTSSEHHKLQYKNQLVSISPIKRFQDTAVKEKSSLLKLTPLYKSIEVPKPSHVLKILETSPISMNLSINTGPFHLLQKFKKKKVAQNPYLIIDDIQQEDQRKYNIQQMLKTLMNRNQQIQNTISKHQIDAQNRKVD